MRLWIAGLIVLATAGFVVGTTIERSSGESHPERPAAASSEHAVESGGETQEASAKETAGETAHEELRPLGVDIEAVPFVVLAALASLAMAAAVWMRPRSVVVLGVVALAMLLFAALDVREILHQIDENRTGLAILAGVVAAVHLAAAALIAQLARGDSRREPGRAATMHA